MNFAIEFLPPKNLEFEPDPGTTIGAIEIGDFRERFQASLSFWSPADYMRSWQAGLERITYSNKSCLITNMYDPKKANFIVWWPLYREGETIWIQNHFLFLRRPKKKLVPVNPYPLIPDRRTVDEEGRVLSEWRTSLTAVRQFFQQIKKR